VVAATRIRFRASWLFLLTVFLLASPAVARELPNVDALASKGGGKRRLIISERQLREYTRPDRTLHTQDILGVPDFLWASPPAPGSSPLKRGLNAVQAAREHLGRYAPLYDLDSGQVQEALAGPVHDTGQGAILVAFRQRVNGIDVFRNEMRLAMTRDLDLVAISGYLAGATARDAARVPPLFSRSAREAIAAAYRDLTDVSLAAADFEPAGKPADGYEFYRLRAGLEAGLERPLVQPVRIRQVYFHLPDRLEPGFYVEINAGPAALPDSDYYAYVISANDASILFRNNLTVKDSFTYRVWAEGGALPLPNDGPQGNSPTPHPTGLPDGYQAPFVSPSLVTLQNGPISTNDPWLAPGATQTTGNNVDAYADLVSPDGFSAGDLRATTTSTNTFDRTYNTALAPGSSSTQRQAAITQLFYNVNFFHDWYYDTGYNEAAGNSQTNNFGRGGLGNDSIRAEAQDFSGRNNADMATPADGARPRMQMYIFDGIGQRALNVNSPASIAGAYPVGVAQFGPASFNTTNAVILVNDGVATTSDGCETPFANAAALSGKIAFLDRGNCSFAVKVKNAQVNGAIGAIIANNTSTGFLDMAGTDGTITIPSLFVSQADGNTIRAQFGVGVNANLFRAAAVDRDGTIDNTIVAHEWGHSISNRLIGNANGLNNNQGGGMGEGWADFHAMLMVVREADALVASNANFSGVYGMAGYVESGGINGPLPNNGYYFGIRRVPYSTDFSKDPLTFQHIAAGVPLPNTAPIAYGADGSENNEVHATGEVWATMLWECYASLLRDTARLTFNQARDRMRGYLVAAYKMTPVSPTFLEARDALLAVAYAADNADFVLFSQAFARRGAGIRAVAPDRYSITQQGVAESYVAGNDLSFVSATLDDNVAYCDRDGVIDSGETGTLTLTLKNTGNGPLAATTATVSSANPALGFPGGSVPVPASQPFQTVVTTLPVTLASVSGMQSLPLTIQLNDPAFAIPGAVSIDSAQRGNYDDVLNQSAADDVESTHPAWTPGFNPALNTSEPWVRLALSPSSHFWHGPDSNALADQYLVSPVLNVAVTGSFSFSFSHRYSFETDGASFLDGGVIEISNNGGSSWTDIGSSASPGYTGSIAAGGGNPLSGRSAYAGSSVGYPAFATVTVSLGTAYQGQTVRIRFRIGTDGATGAPGWDIDNLFFNNLTNLPFAVLVADRHLCIDTDSDGVADLNDCAPNDSALWAAPSEARDLTLDAAVVTNLTWSAPTSPGGTSVLYDLIRDTAASFAGGSCLVKGATGLSSTDASSPSPVLFYLVRSRNACGGNLGTNSVGTPRTFPPCP
jgi:hypothetical protein